MIAQANHVRIEHLVFDGAPLPHDCISEPAHPATSSSSRKTQNASHPELPLRCLTGQHTPVTPGIA
jgi:hypothetical protein